MLEWNEKTLDQKEELYSKYACHELNFFIYKKDQEPESMKKKRLAGALDVSEGKLKELEKSKQPRRRESRTRQLAGNDEYFYKEFNGDGAFDELRSHQPVYS